MSFLLVLLIILHYPLDKGLSSVYMVLGITCVRYVKKQSNTRTGCPFRFKGAWSGEFKPYNIGRETASLGLYAGMHARKILAYVHLLP